MPNMSKTSPTPLAGKKRLKTAVATLSLAVLAITSPSVAIDEDLMLDYRIAASEHALKTGQPALAARGYRRALAKTTDKALQAELQVNLCAAQRLAGQQTEAALACQEALALNPMLWQAEINLALLAEEIGQPLAAKAAFERAIAIRQKAEPGAAVPMLAQSGLARLDPQLASASN